MNIFFLLFLIMPILGFISVYLITGSLINAIVALFIIDVIFTTLFIIRRRRATQ
ncbi:hypothetical protein ACFOLA_08025 [Salinicoccus hispanicus]|uniref:Uncharacterized protein n=1 Tax=Salinicoccus hispanicus TaxID=157225 RepID=A0A6N8U1P4_9STAP|nr:hypothetical protein [Salinicoccus hispanicus]MXQ51702.1 hypothetical protein [Salinicoccus hispanicus]